MPDSPHFPLEGRVVYPTIEFFINGMQTSSHYSVRPVLPISFSGLYIHCSSLFNLSIFSASSSSAIPIPKTGIRFLSAHIVHPPMRSRRSISTTFRYPLSSPTSPISYLSMLQEQGKGKVNGEQLVT